MVPKRTQSERKTKTCVAVLTSEESYGKALARGIAGESDKIIVKTACFGTLTCQERQRLTEELINNGYIVVRLNFSHGTLELVAILGEAAAGKIDTFSCSARESPASLP